MTHVPGATREGMRLPTTKRLCFSVGVSEGFAQRRPAEKALRAGKEGSAGRTRTCDPVVNSHLLYQLSYRGLGVFICGFPGTCNNPIVEGRNESIACRSGLCQNELYVACMRLFFWQGFLQEDA